MVGDDRGAIGIPGQGLRLGLQLRAIQLKLRHIRIAVGQPGAAPFQQQHDIQGGGFPEILDVLFIGDAQDVDVRSLHRLADVVERILDLVHHEVGHLAVNIARQLDEAGLDAGLLGLPGKIKRIDRNTMAAQARTGIERHEAEGLGGGRLDHLPDVNAHAVAHQRHLVD